jgi:multidrug efflux system membrane fusion protein
MNTSRRNSILLACGIAIAMAAWMLSGLGSDPAAPSTARNAESGALAGSNSERLMRVTVRRSQARQTTRELVVSGRTEPNRAIELKAETDGTVVALGAERGSRVTAGAAIVTLDIRDRRARLDEAEALIVQRQLEFEAAEKLRGQNFVSESQIAEAKARLVSAQTARERIALDIGYTKITAPFDAIVQDRSVEIGDYVSSGDVVADLVDTDPLIVVGEINEREVGELLPGATGSATLVGGTKVEGRVRYLSPLAAEETRTFRVELAVPNPEGRLRAGITAEIRLEAGAITAHSLSPALLALADDGTIGVKAVDEFNRVRFYPVEIVGDSEDGMLVTGLPQDLRVISVGQGFVIEGQTVMPVEESAELSQSDNERAY